MAELSERPRLFPRAFALVYATGVLFTMSLSLSASVHNNAELVALVLALPWGLAVRLALDSLDPALVSSLGPPLVALGGLLNAYLLFNALGGKQR